MATGSENPMEESGGSNDDVNEPVTNEYLLKVLEIKEAEIEIKYSYYMYV